MLPRLRIVGNAGISVMHYLKITWSVRRLDLLQLQTPMRDLFRKLCRSLADSSSAERGGWERGPNEDRVDGHERARAARRQSLAHVLQLLLQEETSEMGMGWSQSSTHTDKQWAEDCLGRGRGRGRQVYVLLGGVAEGEHLTRHCQCTHE